MRLALRHYYRSFQDCDVIQYVGIADDEPKRLARLKSNQVSLLHKYGYTEDMAYNLCKKYNLLSPIYGDNTRGGCWFCMNSKLPQYVRMRRKHPEIWEQLRQLSKRPNLCSYGFKYGKTLQEIEKEMDALQIYEDAQLLLF